MTTTAATPTRPAWSWASLRDDSRQFIVVLVVLAIAMIAALALKGVSESQTRIVRGGGVSGAVPADWVYQPGAGDLLFIASDPRIPGHRYLVSRTQANGRDLRAVVDTYTGAKAQLQTAYQAIGREQVTIGNRSGEAVTYAFVIEREGQAPWVIQARDVFFMDGDRILVISTEAPADRFAASIGAFDAFVRSVGV